MREVVCMSHTPLPDTEANRHRSHTGTEALKPEICRTHPLDWGRTKEQRMQRFWDCLAAARL